MRGLLIPLLAAAVLAPQSCEESDAVSLRVQLAEDLSGRLTTSSLVIPDASIATETGSTGVTWDQRVGILAGTGAFTQVEGLAVGEIRFGSGRSGPTTFVRVEIPRGREVQWPRLFTPVRADERKEALDAFSSKSLGRTVGATIKFVIEAPAEIVSAGARPGIKGVDAELSRKEATLVVSVDAALTDGEPIVWHLTW